MPLKKSKFATSCALETYLLALQEKSKGFKLETIKAIFNLTLTQESSLLGLLSRSQTLVQLLTFSRPKINNSKKSKISRISFPVPLNMNSLQKSKRLYNKTMQKTKTSPQLKNYVARTYHGVDYKNNVAHTYHGVGYKNKNYFSVKFWSQITESNSRAKSQIEITESNIRAKSQKFRAVSQSRTKINIIFWSGWSTMGTWKSRDKLTWCYQSILRKNLMEYQQLSTTSIVTL